MKNAVVVLNYNDYSETIRFCKQIYPFKCIDMIVIVDNCSSDDSVEHLNRIKNEKIKLICADKNKGYAAGNNIGIRYVINTYKDVRIVISNPDIYITESSMEKVLNAVDNPNVGMATGLIYTNNRIISNYAWKLPSFSQELANQFFVLYKLLKIAKKSIYLDYPDLKKKENVECDCVAGCFFCIKSDVWKKIGLLDERTFLYGEENILGFNLKRNGFHAEVVVDAKLEHRLGHSISKDVNGKKRNMQKNALAAMQVYNQYYLNKRKFQRKIFGIVFWIAMFEQHVVTKVLSVLQR